MPPIAAATALSDPDITRPARQVPASAAARRRSIPRVTAASTALGTSTIAALAPSSLTCCPRPVMRPQDGLSPRPRPQAEAECRAGDGGGGDRARPGEQGSPHAGPVFEENHAQPNPCGRDEEEADPCRNRRARGLRNSCSNDRAQYDENASRDEETREAASWDPSRRYGFEDEREERGGEEPVGKRRPREWSEARCGDDEEATVEECPSREADPLGAEDEARRSRVPRRRWKAGCPTTGGSEKAPRGRRRSSAAASTRRPKRTPPRSSEAGSSPPALRFGAADGRCRCHGSQSLREGGRRPWALSRRRALTEAWMTGGTIAPPSLEAS